MKGLTRTLFSLGLALLLLAAPLAALADVLDWDADDQVIGDQHTINLGEVAPGDELTVSVSVRLVCAGKAHVDQGQRVSVTYRGEASTVPDDGSMSATDTTIGPIPESWPDDTTGGGSTNCPSGDLSLAASEPSVVSLTAPSTPGNYEYVAKYRSSLSPSGSGDNNAITGPEVQVTIRLTVSAPSDTTPPVITPSVSGTLGNDDWYVSDVTVSWEVVDEESEVSETSGCEQATIDYDTAGVTLTCTATSAGGTASESVTIKRDATPPSITWSNGPQDGASYYYGFVPAEPTCTAGDALSGPNGCAVTGYGAAVGSHTLTATAYDVAGNKAEETRTYTVLAWTLLGFYRPVEMSALNTAKGGSTVPLKFEVFAGETELTEVSVVKSFTTRVVACDSSAIEDPVDITTTGGTSLRYDPVAGQFIQNWQTPKQPGKCYLVTMTTQDGSSIAANFKLK